MYGLVEVPVFEELPKMGVYQACMLNELVSLQERHLVDTPALCKVTMRRVQDNISTWMASGTVSKWSEAQVIAHKGSSALRRRYADAFKALAERGLRDSDYFVRAFIKIEKWDEALLGTKAPRMIQYRSFVYCAALSQYLCPVEELAWTTMQLESVPIFAKGRNSWAVADMLRDCWEAKSQPVAICADHSKFDSSVLDEHLDIEEAAYLEVMPDDYLRELLSHQRRNKCYSKGGIRYTCKVRKMSGEYNTSLGDSVINYGCLRDAFGQEALYIINGDDSVIIQEENRVDEDRIQDPTMWARYGFKTTIEFVREFEQIEFCQSRPVWMGHVQRWRMVRGPWRAIARSSISVKRYNGDKAWLGLLSAMAHSELACSDGVPMLQAWANYLYRCSGSAPIMVHEVSYKAKLEGWDMSKFEARLVPVHHETRESFAVAFGIPVARQLDFERSLETLTASCIQVVR